MPSAYWKWCLSDKSQRLAVISTGKCLSSCLSYCSPDAVKIQNLSSAPLAHTAMSLVGGCFWRWQSPATCLEVYCSTQPSMGSRTTLAAEGAGSETPSVVLASFGTGLNYGVEVGGHGAAHARGTSFWPAQSVQSRWEDDKETGPGTWVQTTIWILICAQCSFFPTSPSAAASSP